MTIQEINRTLDKLNLMAEQAMAHEIITERNQEAHEYCQKYLSVRSWGRNIWHAILDDAIRMRKEMEQKKETPK